MDGVSLRPAGVADAALVGRLLWDFNAELDDTEVGADLRGSGVGTALLTAALAASRDRGAEEMHIGVDEVDADARRFYERHGFSNLEPGTSDRMLFYERTL